jgi:hypothetical protein
VREEHSVLQEFNEENRQKRENRFIESKFFIHNFPKIARPAAFKTASFPVCHFPVKTMRT